MENGEENMDENQLRQRKIISSAKQKLGSASKLLRKKIPCTGHLMTPRKLWIQMVPTRECDVVLMFPSSTSNTILMWLLTRLKNGAPGLAVHLRHHSSSDSYGFYLTAPYKVLLKAAEQYNLPKLLKKTYGGGLKEFTEKDLLCFEGTENKNNFFTTQERQWLVLKVLHNLRANESDVKEKPAGVHLNEGQAIVPKFLTAGVISQVFPLHELPCLEKLQKSWVQAFFEKQPLDDICDYFGVKIAMYFAWLGHYTMALIVPAIVGFLFWIGFCRGDQATEDVLYVLFSLFNVIWTSIYLEAWKRCSATLAYKWGTLDQRNDLLVEPRPFFTGPLEVSPVTNRLEPTYPSWKRYVFRYFVTVPIMAVCLAVVFITMIIILQVQDWWDAVLQRRGFPFFLSYFPKILLAIVITFFDEAYYKDQEKLKEQLAALLITRQVIGNIKESALPYLLEQIRLAKLSFDLFGALSPSDAKKFPGQQTEEDESQVEDGSSVDSKTDSVKSPNNRSIGQAELESTLFKYDGTFEDHLEMFIQMGYVVLFSSAFPMAAFCAVINNLIEIRSDAFKLCFIFQRPFGERVPGIGRWQNAMEVMGLIAVLVNCALIGLSGQVQRMFPEMSTTQTILLIVALEHIMLILHYLISYSIPDLPEWVATEIAKVEFARRQAECPCSTTAQENNGLEIGRFVVSSSPKMSSQTDTEEKNSCAEIKGDNNITEGNAKSESEPASEAARKTYNSSGAVTPEIPSPTVKTPQKLGHHWLAPEDGGHHLTIGSHPSADWMRRFALDKTRKTSEPEVSSKSGEGLTSYRSTDCLPKDSSSSDSDLLRSAPPWSRSKFRFGSEREKKPGGLVVSQSKATTPTSPVSTSGQESATSSTKSLVKAPDPAEIAAKKQRIKRSLMKRARSVAIFSLKLKERRAVMEKELPEAPKTAKETKPAWGVRTEGTVGGELGCIPIEMLISVDDIAKDLQRRQNPST